MSRFVLWAAALLPPCLPLLTGPPQTLDWVNNVWFVTYAAEHIQRTGLPPVVHNTAELGGNPYPIFYGFLIYPLLGAAAVVLGPTAALKLTVVGVFALQFALVRRAVRDGGGTDRVAAAAACLTVWAVYPLTNVYARGAVMEFLAVGLLTGAVCRWFALLDADTLRGRVRAALEVGILYTLAAGAHPITMLCGFCFLAALALTAFARVGPAGASAVGRLGALVPAGILTVAVLSPFVYACAVMRPHMTITDMPMYLFPESIDSWWQRLLSVPMGVWIRAGVLDQGAVAAHLDTQMNGPLVVVAVAAAAAVRGRRAWWLAVPVGLGVTSFVMSVRLEPYEVLPSAFRMVQFPYRMVTYVNMAALAGLLLAVRLAGARSDAAAPPRAPLDVRGAPLAVAAALSVVPLGLQLYGLSGRSEPVPVSAHHLPPTFYGWDPYTTNKLYAAIAPNSENEARYTRRVRLPLSPGGRQRYESVHVSLSEPRVVIVQVQPFPWTVFEVNGVRVPDDNTFVWHGPPEDRPDPEWKHRPYLGAMLPAGEHDLVHRFRPPLAWRALAVLSAVTLLPWAGGLLAARLRRTARPRA